MSEAQTRFEREAMAAAGLRSMHVVEVYDYGVEEGLPFIVMELLEGETLSMRLRRGGRQDIAEAAWVVVQVAKGLKAAHEAGLIHRDLKPSNIFMARRDDVEVVKLLDFGVVKATDRSGSSDATASGMLLGTPQYMSPEQARATRQIDHRSDLWSFGVIIFRMLGGKNPFRGESVGDVVLKICSDELPSLGDYASDLPAEFDDFFATAFARRPDDRFQSATEMATAFLEICQEQYPELQLVPMDAGSGAFPYARPSLSGIRPPVPSASAEAVDVAEEYPRTIPLEPTPHSATVAGTPLASKAPPAPRAARSVAAGFAVVMVVAGGLLALAWLGTMTRAGSGATSAELEPTTAVAAQPGPLTSETVGMDAEDPSSDEVSASTEAVPGASGGNLDEDVAVQPADKRRGRRASKGVAKSDEPAPEKVRAAPVQQVTTPRAPKGGKTVEPPSWFD